MQPLRKRNWGIQPLCNATFVASVDESDKQCIGEMRQTRPTKLGPQQRAEHEYVHNGHNQVFPEIEPLTRRRHVAVTESRTRRD